MAAFMLSFRLHDDTIGGRTYEERREGLYDRVHQIASPWWEETTSFIAFQSDLEIDDIMWHVKDEIAAGYDIVLVRSLESKVARITGVLEDGDIYKIMPYLKEA